MSESFRPSSRNFGRVVQTAFDLSVGSFWEVFLKKKSDTFYHSRTQSKRFPAFSRLFSSRFVRKNYLNFFNSGHWAKNFGPFVEKNSKAAKTAFNTFTGTVSKKCFFEEILKFFLFLRTLSEKTSAFYQSLSDDVVKCVFYVSIGKLRRNFFFWKNI